MLACQASFVSAHLSLDLTSHNLPLINHGERRANQTRCSVGDGCLWPQQSDLISKHRCAHYKIGEYSTEPLRG